MTRVTALVVACVRCWTRIYTWGLPAALREARREEIESDLWESAHDAQMTQSEVVMQMLMRTILGAMDDLAWRVAHLPVTRSATYRRVAAAVVMCTLLIFAAAFRLAAGAPVPPQVPTVGASVTSWYLDTPAYPPPPPPPPVAGAGEIDWQYADTSFVVADLTNTPTKVKDVRPVYPPMAISMGVEGRVVVQAAIDARGNVFAARVVESIPLLNQSTIDAVKQWRFDPATMTGTAPTLINVEARFSPQK
jgi:TonB family protein